MTQSTLNVTTSEIQGEIARYMGFSALTYAGCNASEQADIDRILKRGLRRFYNPPPVFGETTNHQWSFLTPATTLSLSASTATYSLPDLFGGIIGPFTITSSTMSSYIEIVSDERIRRAIHDIGSQSGTPRMAAIMPKVSSGDSPDATPDIPTIWQATFFPTPDATYTVSYRYYVAQDLATSSLNPPGGSLHAETILAACLMVAEETLNNQNTRRPIYLMKEMFSERIAASVALDRRMSAPYGFGKNLDRESLPTQTDRYSTVTYDGVQY